MSFSVILYKQTEASWTDNRQDNMDDDTSYKLSLLHTTAELKMISNELNNSGDKKVDIQDFFHPVYRTVRDARHYKISTACMSMYLNL